MFDKTFSEAMKSVLNHEGYAVGERFQHGVFLDSDEDNNIIMKERKENGIGYQTIGNPVLSKGLLEQKYKIIVAATDRALGLVK